MIEGIKQAYMSQLSAYMHGKKAKACVPTNERANLDDGRDELLQEAGQLEEGGPEVVQQIDEQALDVAP